MEQPGDPERIADATVTWNRMQASLEVEVDVLAGVEDVETCYPESDGSSEEQDAWVEGASDGDPGGGRGYAQGKSQHQVRPTGPALGVGVEQQNGQSHWREQESEVVQLPCCEHKNRRRQQSEIPDEGLSEFPCREGACTGAWVGGVTGSIGEAVERHGSGTGGDHGYDDP